MGKKLYFYLICKLLKQQICKYEKLGYLIKKKKDLIQVTYQKKNYKIFIIKKVHKYYLKLIPYKTSYFKTELNFKDIKLKVDMSLFAITEDN